MLLNVATLVHLYSDAVSNWHQTGGRGINKFDDIKAENIVDVTRDALI